MYTNKNNPESTVEQIHSSNQLNIGMFILINDQDEIRLCRVKLINHLVQEIQVQYYEPPFPGTIFYVSRLKHRNHVNINLQNVLLTLRHNPVLGKQDEIYLNAEQVFDIKSFCDEL